LLLADHCYFSQLFLRNEQIGETRVNWFIGIVTGATGGLVALITKDGFSAGMLRLIVIAALISLLVFGVVTLFRILQRNRTTDGFKRDLDNVRQVFRDHFDPEYVLMDYQPLGSPKKKPLKAKEIGRPPGARKFGGLAYTVAAINSLLAAALAASIVYAVGNTVSALVPLVFNEETESNRLLAEVLAATTIHSALVALVLSFVVQALLITSREEASKIELRAGGVTHAGGVVFTRPPNNAAVEYLIARPSDNVTEWILPKGHVEDKENHAQTALREVCEETGVLARVIRMIGTVEYATEKDGPIKVKFYLMEKLFDDEASEPRERRWVSYPTVLRLLTHEESRRVVEMAETVRHRES
jgi:ADP-ribose pyrophosphatase YjhB (NUDIX family)